MEIKQSETQTKQLHYYHSNDPKKIVKQFCDSENLPESIFYIILDQLLNELKNYHQPDKKPNSRPKKERNSHQKNSLSIKEDYQEITSAVYKELLAQEKEANQNKSQRQSEQSIEQIYQSNFLEEKKSKETCGDAYAFSNMGYSSNKDNTEYESEQSNADSKRTEAITTYEESMNKLFKKHNDFENSKNFQQKSSKQSQNKLRSKKSQPEGKQVKPRKQSFKKTGDATNKNDLKNVTFKFPSNRYLEKSVKKPRSKSSIQNYVSPDIQQFEISKSNIASHDEIENPGQKRKNTYSLGDRRIAEQAQKKQNGNLERMQSNLTSLSGKKQTDTYLPMTPFNKKVELTSSDQSGAHLSSDNEKTPVQRPSSKSLARKSIDKPNEEDVYGNLLVVDQTDKEFDQLLDKEFQNRMKKITGVSGYEKHHDIHHQMPPDFQLITTHKDANNKDIGVDNHHKKRRSSLSIDDFVQIPNSKSYNIANQNQIKKRKKSGTSIAEQVKKPAMMSHIKHDNPNDYNNPETAISYEIWSEFCKDKYFHGDSKSVHNKEITPRSSVLRSCIHQNKGLVGTGDNVSTHTTTKMARLSASAIVSGTPPLPHGYTRHGNNDQHEHKKHHDLYERGFEMIAKKTQKIVYEKVKQELKEDFEFRPNINKNSNNLTKDYANQPINYRLLNWGEQQKEKKKTMEKTRIEELEQECKPKPDINEYSKFLTRSYDNNFTNHMEVYDKLFYKGIENQRRKEEACDLEFNLRYPFTPKTNHNDNQVISFLTKDDINRLAYKSEVSKTKEEEKVWYASNFDANTGQKLFTPKVHKSRSVTPVKQNEKTWTDMTEFKTKKKIFDRKVRQIFQFLDFDNNGVQHIDCLKNFKKNLKGVFKKLLYGILCVIIRNGVILDYRGFYELVIEKELFDEIDLIFDQIDLILNQYKYNIKQNDENIEQNLMHYSQTTRTITTETTMKKLKVIKEEYRACDLFDDSVAKLHMKRIGVPILGKENCNKEEFAMNDYISPNYRKIIKKNL